MKTMKRRMACMLFLAQTSLGAWAAGSASLSERYLDALDETLTALKADVPAVVASAEAVAKAYVADDAYGLGAEGDPGFVCEAQGRSGGLMRMRPHVLKRKTAFKGAILYALREDALDEDVRLIRESRESGALVVAFGREALLRRFAERGGAADFRVANRAPAEGGLIRLADGSRIIPTDHPANTAALWVWMGEFFAACTREGKLPHIFQGYAVKGGRERAERLSKQRFFEGPVTAIPARRAGEAFIDRTLENTARIRARELAAIRAVAQAAFEARKNGKKLYVFPHNHVLLDRPGTFRDPNYFVRISKGWFDAREDIAVRAGDLVFCMAFNRTYAHPEWGDFVKNVRQRGGRLIWSLTDQDPDEISALPKQELVIRQHWHYSDAVVDIPGYEVRMLPTSGVVSEAIYWMVNAELHALIEASGRNP